MANLIIPARVETTLSLVKGLGKIITRDVLLASAEKTVKAFVDDYRESGRTVTVQGFQVLKTDQGYRARLEVMWSGSKAAWIFPFVRVETRLESGTEYSVGIWDTIRERISYFDPKTQKIATFPLPSHIGTRLSVDDQVKFCFRTQRLWEDSEWKAVEDVEGS